MSSNNEGEYIIKRDEINRQDASREDFKAVTTSFNELMKSIRSFPWDWRFNSILYGMDVYSLLRELTFVYASMKASHDVYVIHSKKSSRNVPFLLNLYIGDVLFRLISIRDKLFMAYAAFFAYHDPETRNSEKALSAELKKLISEAPNGVMLESFKEFLTLKGLSHWYEIEEYRHMKVHRLEPKIDAYKIESHHDWSYLKKISYEEARKKAEEDFETGYALEDKSKLSPEYKENEILQYLRRRSFEGSYYERMRPDSRLTDYPEIAALIEKCVSDLMRISAQYYKSLYESPPFCEMPIVFKGESPQKHN